MRDENKAVLTYTDAPEDYDGFGTLTVVPSVGKSKRGNVRLVSTPAHHVEWQRARYASGLYCAMSDAQWAAGADVVLEQPSVYTDKELRRSAVAEARKRKGRCAGYSLLVTNTGVVLLIRVAYKHGGTITVRMIL